MVSETPVVVTLREKKPGWLDSPDDGDSMSRKIIEMPRLYDSKLSSDVCNVLRYLRPRFAFCSMTDGSSSLSLAGASHLEDMSTEGTPAFRMASKARDRVSPCYKRIQIRLDANEMRSSIVPQTWGKRHSLSISGMPSKLESSVIS